MTHPIAQRFAFTCLLSVGAAACALACAADEGGNAGGTGIGGASTMPNANGGALPSSSGGAATTGRGGSSNTNPVSSGGSASAPASGGNTSSTTATTTKFSFFVASYKAMQDLSGNTLGFGGDLRYGETGDGAGLRGADKICTTIAEKSMPGNGKTWRAFLSTSTVNAIDRVGAGPWYDRLGRTVALSKAGLLSTRPVGADATIINDLPNEDGVPNHAPDGTVVDNHDTLTGSSHLGVRYSASATCSDWTSSAADTSQKPRVGHSWPRDTSMGGITGGRGQGGSSGSTTVASGNTAGMDHWISALDESGCAPGVNLVQTGGPGRDGSVGSGGGYGGIYCFALTP